MFDEKVLDKQRAYLFNRDALVAEDNIQPLKNYVSIDHSKFDHDLACQTGVLLVAGGVGSRLGFDKPKGMFPISNVKNKTLFQIFAEKVAVASLAVDKALPLAVMVSSEHYGIVKDYFEENNLFGLDESQLNIFSQEELPYLDDNGDLVLDEEGRVVLGPSGNGGALRNFCQAGIWQKWHAVGIKYLNFVLIDNPMMDPYDTTLISEHINIGAEISIKCVEREDVMERVGVVCSLNKQVGVVEYNELKPEEACEIDDRGRLIYNIANISSFCFGMDFVKRVENLVLPWHLAYKQVSSCNGRVWAWKFEEFIFDLLKYSNKVNVAVYPRKDVFSPLKKMHGSDSVETVRSALLARDYKVLSGLNIDKFDKLIELSQDYFYNSKVVPRVTAYEKGEYWHI